MENNFEISGLNLCCRCVRKLEENWSEKALRKFKSAGKFDSSDIFNLPRKF